MSVRSCTKCGKDLQRSLDPTGRLSKVSHKPTFYIRWKCTNKSNGVGHDDYHERNEDNAKKEITDSK